MPSICCDFERCANRSQVEAHKISTIQAVSASTGIPNHINGAWFGWHAYRRGLGTRLNDMGMNAIDIQRILRHASIATTLAYHTFPNPEKAKACLKKLTETVRQKYGIKA